MKAFQNSVTPKMKHLFEDEDGEFIFTGVHFDFKEAVDIACSQILKLMNFESEAPKLFDYR